MFDWSGYMGATPSRVLSVKTNPVAPVGGSSLSGNTGGGMGDTAAIGQISQAYQAAQDKANAANQQRYDQGLAIQKQGVGLADQVGLDTNRRVNSQYQSDVGATEQSAVSRGLGNTTIRNSLLDADARRRDDAKLAATSAVAQNKQGALQNESAFIAARNDTAPDPALAASLMSGAANGAASSGNSLALIAQALGLGNQIKAKK